MSRETRVDYTNRMVAQNNRSKKRQKVDLSELSRKFNQAIRRHAIEDGLLDPDNKFHFWHYENHSVNRCAGTVIAVSRSEARALIKKELGISKRKPLPPTVRVRKGDKTTEDTPFPEVALRAT